MAKPLCCIRNSRESRWERETINQHIFKCMFSCLSLTLKFLNGLNSFFALSKRKKNCRAKQERDKIESTNFKQIHT